MLSSAALSPLQPIIVERSAREARSGFDFDQMSSPEDRDESIQQSVQNGQFLCRLFRMRRACSFAY
jgi:hypothetical protein